MIDKQIPNERRQYEYKSVYPENQSSIMTDDVDVSGCEFALETIDTDRIKCLCIKGSTKMSCDQPESIRRDWCDQNPDCLYKQYSRKEQECKRLKLDLIEAKAHGDYLNNLALSKTLDTVSEEAEQLRKRNNQLVEQNFELAQKYTELEKEAEQLRFYLRKYR